MPSLFGVRRRHEGRQPESSTWISGVAAGAGKLISFVFNSNDRSTTPSLSYSTEDPDSSHSDEHMVVSSKEPDAPKQVESKLEPAKDFNETSTAIISEINSKHAIEQMIMQETFTRDEGHNLIKLIESRVFDAGNNVDAHKKLPEKITYPSDASPFLELTPDLRSSAVVEAKKWLEEKRLAMSSNVNSEDRPSNVISHDSGGEDRSPADVAKSYMQSLPLSSSPSLVTTPTSSEHKSKGLKRSYIEADSKMDEIRNVRPNSTDLTYKMSADNEFIQRSPCNLSDKTILGSGVDNAASLTHEASSPIALPSALDSSAEADTLNHDIAMQGNNSETPLTVNVQDVPSTDITLSQDNKTVAEMHDYHHSTTSDDSLRPTRRSSARKKQSVPESSQQDGDIPVQSRENKLKSVADGSPSKLVVDHNADGAETSSSTRAGPLTRSGLRKSRANKDPLYKPPQPSTRSRGQGRKSVPTARRSKAK